jgi:RNA-directed DNA polymerase
LAPVAETTGDPNSYGFREYRSCADAIQQCWNCLANPYTSRWILEADVEACFDTISHEWMLSNILLDRKILRAWLKAGYIDKGKLYPTKAGTPQGGIISPLLANMTLDGLESTIKSAVPEGSKVNVVRYADDFIVTGKSKELLQDTVIPAINSFLSARGLKLSGEKTIITGIQDGFDFLGQHLRKYGEKYLPTPAKSAVKAIIAKTGKIIKDHTGATAWRLIEKLNPIIRGWANYHCHICSKRTFAYVDSRIFRQIWNWATRRHTTKGKRWVMERYFRSVGSRRWSFFAYSATDTGKPKTVDLFHMDAVKIIRHVKIRGLANPYDRDWQEYFARRKQAMVPDTVFT